MKLLRGIAPEIVKLLKSGKAELAIAADLGEGWEHLDRWPLFSEEFGLMFSAKHRFASRSAIDVDELRRCICATQLLSPNIEATVYLHGVVGRQRTAAASAILTMLRAADWSRHTT